MTPRLTHARLTAVLSYDALTGAFTWTQRLSPKGPLGSIAGSVGSRGYRRIAIDGERFLAHRLAWFYVHETWPLGLLDHRNVDPSDNRIANLREASNCQSLQHRRPLKSRSGLKGARYIRENGRWYSGIDCEKRRYGLGTYDTAEEAHAAYCLAAKLLHGEFARLY